MKKFLSLVVVFMAVLAFKVFSHKATHADPTSAPSTASASSTPALQLPTDNTQRITLSGKVFGWMGDGEAGCFGSLKIGNQELNIWTSEEVCGQHYFLDNQDATIEVTFDPENQYSPDGKTYTITRFM